MASDSLKELRAKLTKVALEGKFYPSTNQKFVFQIAYPWRIVTFTS